jgi:hypothetical protein
MKVFINYILIFILLIGCKQNNLHGYKQNGKVLDNTEEEQPLIYHEYYLMQDYISVNINLYEAKKDIHTLLDSIIDVINNCSDNKNIQIGYTVDAYGVDNYIELGISAINFQINEQLYSRAKGLFFHRGYEFIYFGVFLDKYFIDLNKTVRRNAIDYNRLNYGIDDSYILGTWLFIYDN